jgi:O-antigen/teichoic acid export membrane protein
VVAADHAAGRHAELRTQFVRITRAVVLACLPVAAALTLAPTAVLGAFGHGYTQGAAYLVIMTLGQFVNVLTGSVNTILSMSGHERDLIRSIICGLAVTIVCMIALGPVLGGLGFAIAYAANMVTQNAVAALAVRRRIAVSVADIFRVRGAA